MEVGGNVISSLGALPNADAFPDEQNKKTMRVYPYTEVRET